MSITRATATAGWGSFRSLVFAFEPRFSTGSWINSGSYDGTPRTRYSKKLATGVTKRAEEYCDGDGNGSHLNERRDEWWFGYHGLIKESVTAAE